MIIRKIHQQGKWFKKKCGFCGATTDPLHYIEEAGIYLEAYYYYHTDCLDEVIADPEAHGHRKIDLALHIIYLINLAATEKARKKERLIENIKKLKQNKDILYE